MLVNLSLQEFSARLADKNPTPGGGSASAYVAALGSGLVAMFCNVTAARKKYAQVKEEMEATAEYAEKWRGHFLELVDADSAAFEQVLTANRMPKDDPGRSQAIDEASLQATKVPLQTASACVAMLEKIPPLVTKGNPNAISDLNVGMELLHTAFQGALANVNINLPWLPEADAKSIQEEALELSRRAQAAHEEGKRQFAAL
ncbi:MAG: cyclodeaminase/cyclohydrolase family protein [Firmicutes bacterium]|nr:cyclodeaminase/cyclohydrolase family protein [Bacillota bacterium]